MLTYTRALYKIEIDDDNVVVFQIRIAR